MYGIGSWARLRHRSHPEAVVQKKKKTEGPVSEEFGKWADSWEKQRPKKPNQWPRAREEGRKRYSSPERNNEDKNTCKQFMQARRGPRTPSPDKASHFSHQASLCFSTWLGSLLSLEIIYIWKAPPWNRRWQTVCLPSSYDDPFGFRFLEGKMEGEVRLLGGVFSLL